jgi:hypothetical protein
MPDGDGGPARQTTTAAACPGKRGFATQEQARRVVEVLTPVYHQEGGRVLPVAYRCPHCPGEVWHIGQQPRALQRLLAG